MNVAILPTCPVLRHGVSVLGLGKLVRIYPPPPSLALSAASPTPSAQKAAEGHGGMVMQLDTTDPPQKDT